MSKIRIILVSFIVVIFLLAGCNEKKQIVDTDIDQQTSGSKTEQATNDNKETEKGQNPSDSNEKVDQNSDKDAEKTEQAPEQGKTSQNQTSSSSKSEDGIEVVAQPESIPVLVNKHRKLPEEYTPGDLVTTSIPYLSSATAEKRKLRSEAANAIAQLFAGAKADGVDLLGVSGYRSHATQVSLFNYYVSKDGYEKARTYSAVPGTSEHETGLAIDVTGGDGRCPAEECFGGTIAAKWLQENVADYGFIIRYPEGKDSVTGYKYEPWHLRYVGKNIAKDIMNRSITLEEYFNAVPVNN